MIRARTMAIPTTAVTILFLWRVPEASAKKSVLLWDVMVEGGESADSRAETESKQSYSVPWSNEGREERENHSRCNPTVLLPSAYSAVPLSLCFTELTGEIFVLAWLGAADIHTQRGFQRFLSSVKTERGVGSC